MMEKTKAVINIMDQGGGQLVDQEDPGTELQVEVEMLPGRRGISQIATGIMTLAMGVINEETARRPCIMGGHL